MTFLRELWSCENGGDVELFCSSLVHTEGRPANVLTKRPIKLKRKDKIIEHDDFYLGKYYE